MLFLWITQMMFVAALSVTFKSDSWSFQVYINSRFQINCTDENFSPDPQKDEIFWAVPDKKTYKVPYNDSDFEIRDYYIRIAKVQSRHAGMYICKVHENQQFYRQLVFALNLAGPLYEKPVRKYKDHLIIAFVSACVFVFFFSLLCFIYKFRYKSDPEAILVPDNEYDVYVTTEHKSDSSEKLPEEDTKMGELSTYL